MRRKAFLFALGFLLVGLYVGERFPDIDQRTSLLVHRSVFTHGLLASLLVFWPASRVKANWMRFFAVGFCTGTAVHLAYDLFPRAWFGYALIHVPVIGWTYPFVSWTWIAMAMVWCFYLAMRLVSNVLQGLALVIGTVAVFGYAGIDEDEAFRPLVAILAASTVGIALVIWRTSQASSKDHSLARAD